MQVHDRDSLGAVRGPEFHFIGSRVALHARTLEFTHPTTGRRVKFEAPLPADMQHLLDLLRKHRKE